MFLLAASVCGPFVGITRMPSFQVFFGVARTWRRLVWRDPRGKVVIANIMYDYYSRPETREAIDAFVRFLNAHKRIADDIARIEAGAPLGSLISSLIGAVSAFNRANDSKKFRLMCPHIPPTAFDGRRGYGGTWSRFCTPSKAIRNYAMHSQTCCQVNGRKRRVDSIAATAKMIGDLGPAFLPSTAQRKAIQDAAITAGPSNSRVQFYTFSESLRKIPRYSKLCEASWACCQVGLVHNIDSEGMTRIEFRASARSKIHARRPSVISSDGHEGFCARDDRNHFGRTQRLNSKSVRGVPEFVVPVSEQPRVVGSHYLGEFKSTAMLVANASLIVSDLMRRLRRK